MSQIGSFVSSNFPPGLVVETLTGNSGGAVSPAVNNINVVGDGTTITVAGNPGTHTLTSSVTGGTDGQVLIAATAGNPTWASLTAGANITITPGANSISIAAAGGGGGITTLDGDSGSASGATVSIVTAGTCGATPTFVAGGATVTFNVTDGSFNTLMGHNAGGAPSSNFNTAFGAQAMQSLTSGSANTAVGLNAMVLLQGGSNNTAFGFQSLGSLTSGNNNTAFGNNVMDTLVNGSANTAVGFNAGTAYTGAESSNICLVHTGILGESNTMHLGQTGVGVNQVNAAYIAATFGHTVNAGTGVPVVIDSTELLGTIVSSIRYKENVNDMADVSSRLYDLRPVTFNYKKYPEIESYGLIAEEVEETFPELVVRDNEGNPETVRYLDLIPMLLNEIQKLKKEIDLLKGV